MLQALYRNIATPILDFIYPPLCFMCEQRMTNGERVVCSECWSKLPQVYQDHQSWIEHIARFKREGVVDDLISAFLFEQEGMLQQVLHLLKYAGIKSLGVRLGRELGQRIVTNSKFASAAALIPVPLHKLKQRERGYNQSFLICQGISEVTGIPINHSLTVRKKYTLTQTHLDYEQRKKNVGDAFSINPRSEERRVGKECRL